MYYGQKTAYYKGWLIGYAVRAYVSASTCHGGLNKHVTEKSSPNHTHLFPQRTIKSRYTVRETLL